MLLQTAQVKRLLWVAIATIALSSGCMLAPVSPPRGVLFTNQSLPLFGGEAGGARVGRASVENIAFLISWGDASIHTAAAKAGITDIKHVDYNYYNAAGLYQRYTTVVWGD